jgi:hypothetical protein
MKVRMRERMRKWENERMREWKNERMRMLLEKVL